MRILGVDPGVANIGWAVMENKKVLSFGVKTTKPRTPLHWRLKDIYSFLTAKAAEYQIRVAVIEAFDSMGNMQNKTTAMTIAKAHGAIQCIPCKIYEVHAVSLRRLKVRDRERRKYLNLKDVNKKYKLKLKFSEHHVADAIMLGEYFYGKAKKKKS